MRVLKANAGVFAAGRKGPAKIETAPARLRGPLALA